MPSAPLIRSDTISLTTVMCKSIPEALSFYVGGLGFNVRCDEEIEGGRLVVAAPPNLTEFTPMCSLSFREAKTQRDQAAVGNQAGDGVFLQIESDDWDTVYEKMKTMGTKILDKEPREGEDYRAVTMVDPMGNKVNFVEKTTITIGKVFTKDIPM